MRILTNIVGYNDAFCLGGIRVGRIILALFVVNILLGGHVQGQVIQVGSLRVELERIVDRPPSGQLAFSVYMDTPGDGSDRKFFAEQVGRIQLLQSGSFSTALDLRAETLGTGERGLLGFSFHPGFADANSPGYQKLYTYHSVAVDPNKTVDFTGPGVVSHHNLLTEWRMDASNPNVVDLNSRREIFRQAHASTIHIGGMLDWGPDGYLYGSIGTLPAGTQQLTAQDNSNLYGTMYRIDPVDPNLTPSSTDPISANGKYRIPAGNPFLSNPTALDEIFAYGLRSPYRFSVDPVTGLVFMGDVGQGAREEIDVVPAGGNMGWPYREGTRSGTQPTPSPAPEMIEPIAEYSHADGISVIGGYVYRGSIPELQGKYIFGEFAFGPNPQRIANPGRLFWIDPFDDMGNVKDFSEIRIQEIATGPATCASSYNSPGDCTFDVALLSFATDDDGELYAIGLKGGSVSGVVAYKFVSAFFLPDGDYNQNGIVDAADYSIWQDTLGSTTDLRANGDDTGPSFGVIDQADYDVWRTHFGETVSGSGAGTAAVPEPAAAGLALIACALRVFARRRISVHEK